jgi:hypothetical protein
MLQRAGLSWIWLVARVAPSASARAFTPGSSFALLAVVFSWPTCLFVEERLANVAAPLQSPKSPSEVLQDAEALQWRCWLTLQWCWHAAVPNPALARLSQR